MISVFTLGAGVAVAAMMPGRLALWNIPRVATRPAAAASQVLAGAGPRPPCRPAAVFRRAVERARLGGAGQAGGRGGHRPWHRAGAVRPGSLGPHPAGIHHQTGHRRRRAGRPRPLGPVHHPRGRRRVAWIGCPGRRGDPTLAAGSVPASDYPQPATLRQLAAAPARALRAQGRRSARISYDTLLYSGPPLAPGWPEAYITTGNVTAITPLEVERGSARAGRRRTRMTRATFGPGPPTRRPRRPRLAAFLGADGIRVSGQPGQQKAGAHAATLATVSSPPLSAIVGWMLRENNKPSPRTWPARSRSAGGARPRSAARLGGHRRGAPARRGRQYPPGSRLGCHRRTGSPPP